MAEKIVNLFPKKKISHRALLHQILEREDVDGVVCVVRIDGAWNVCCGGDVNNGGLSMAALTLMHDVMNDVREE